MRKCATATERGGDSSQWDARRFPRWPSKSFDLRVEELTRDHLRTLVGMSQGPPYDLHPDDRPPLSARDVHELESKMADLLRQKEELIKQLQGQATVGVTASPDPPGPGLARQFSRQAEVDATPTRDDVGQGRGRCARPPSGTTRDG